MIEEQMIMRKMIFNNTDNNNTLGYHKFTV